MRLRELREGRLTEVGMDAGKRLSQRQGAKTVSVDELESVRQRGLALMLGWGQIVRELAVE